MAGDMISKRSTPDRGVTAGAGLNTAETFTFVSRPFGLALLFVLTLAWLLDFLWLMYVLVFQADLSDEAPTLPTPEAEIGLTLGVGIWVLYMVRVLVFLLWIYKIHQDLQSLSPTYPITPHRAVAEAAIPIYNLRGLARLFENIVDEFPERRMFNPFLPAATVILLGVGNRIGNNISSAWALGAAAVLSLAATSIWLFITLKVHRSLDVRFQRMVADMADKLLSAASVGSTGAWPSPTVEVADKLAAPHRKRRLAVALLITGLLATLALARCGPAVVTLVSWFDSDYFHLLEVLAATAEPDGRVAEISPQISLVSVPNQEKEAWLLLAIATTETCLESQDDPCESLANQYAYVVLQEYARLDELGGLEVVVTPFKEGGPVANAAVLDKAMTINDWRKEVDSSPATRRG